MEQFRPKPKQTKPISKWLNHWITLLILVMFLALPVVTLTAVIVRGRSLDRTAEAVVTVGEDDTLTEIARRSAVAPEAILLANGLASAEQIYIGQQLVIPISADNGVMHTVQPGDSLASIATRYRVNFNVLREVNALTESTTIYSGQQLLIPADASSFLTPTGQDGDPAYTLHRVQPGDTLYRISLVYGVSVDEILAVNNLANSNVLYPGLELRIPTGVRAAYTDSSDEPIEEADNEEAPSAPGEPEPTTLTHVVAFGDTLARIAIQYDVTLDGIIAANGINNPNSIYVGQVLVIPLPGAPARPEPAEAATSHEVAAGETLPEIALRYNVTVHSLSVANQISNPSRIFPGLVLTIPSAQVGQDSITKASIGPGLCVEVEIERSGSGYFARPTGVYKLTQPFRAGHSGIDLANDLNTPIIAADGGTVVYSGWNPAGYGNLVVLDHGNGWRTYYAHLNTITVGCNDWVPRGNSVGLMGSTGNSTGPHLHFELLRFGLPVNPAGYIRF